MRTYPGGDPLEPLHDTFSGGEQLRVDLVATSTTWLTFAFADYYFLNPKAIVQERNRNSSLTLSNSVVLRLGGAGTSAQQNRPLGILAFGQQSPAVGTYDGPRVRPPLWL
jgi:hypothetical protein